MRVLHTSDFHAGYTLRGTDRTPEIHEALCEIAGIAKSERVDAVLVSGDVFDKPNPSPQADGAVFDFFLRLRDANIPSIVIAGNHDSAARLDSLTGLLNWVGVQVVAGPKDMVRRIDTASGERLVVGALPYMSERRLVKASDLLGGDTGAWRQRYREGMGFFLRRLGEQFEAGAVNMLMAHTTVDGAKPSGSERQVQFDLTNAYTLSGLQFPAGAQYIALGHIHKPQQVCETPLAAYAGSIVQLDFGESGEKKQVSLIEVSAGKMAHIQSIPLVSGKELRTIRVRVEHLEERLEREKDFGGHLKVVIETPHGSAPAGLKDRVLRVVPQALAIDLKASGEKQVLRPEDTRSGLSLIELYERYWREEKGTAELPAPIRQAFLDVEQQAGHVEPAM